MALCNKKDLQQKSVGAFFGHTARLLETYMISLLRPFGIGLEQLWVLHILHSMDKKVRVSDLAQALLKRILQQHHAYSPPLRRRALLASIEIQGISVWRMCISRKQGYKS